MRAVLLSLGLALTLTAPVAAQDSDAKAVDCSHQASVVRAVQQARKDRVKERDVQAHVLPNADWPESYNAAIPLIAGWVYGRDIKMRDIRNKDLAAAWNELCMAQ